MVVASGAAEPGIVGTVEHVGLVEFPLCYDTHVPCALCTGGLGAEMGVGARCDMIR